MLSRFDNHMDNRDLFVKCRDIERNDLESHTPRNFDCPNFVFIYPATYEYQRSCEGANDGLVFRPSAQ